MHQSAFFFRLINMDKIQAPKDLKSLKNNIISGIVRQEHRRAKNYLIFFAAILLLSLTAVYLSLKYLTESLNQSGFYEYLSLLFSGDSVVYSYWKELSLSLIDSMPVLGIMIFLVALGVLIWSGANTFTNTRRFILQTN